ncbi:P-loop containing nucleoside triphosphate hydrolase protein, partial [Pisolithus albus]
AAFSARASGIQACSLLSWLIRWIRHLIWHGETVFDYGFLFSLPSALQVKASAAFEPDYYTQPALGSSQLYLKSSAWYRWREEFFTECYDLWMRNVGETVDGLELRVHMRTLELSRLHIALRQILITLADHATPVCISHVPLSVGCSSREMVGYAVAIRESQPDTTVHLAGSTDHEEVFSLPRTPSRLRSAADFRSTCPADTLTRLLDTDEGGSLTEDTQGVTVNGLRHTVVLWDHQKVGVVWMRQREQGTKRGGIVADEMGLGKTILGIARILDGRPTSLDRAQGWSRATLVVCPVSLIGQWENEVEKFAIELNVVKHHGPSRSNNPLTLQDIHVVITSYATVASEYAAVCTNSGSRKSALFGVKWWNSYIFWNEFIHVFRQNGVEDLYSMFRFMNVKPLGDLQAFKSHIIKPTKGGQATLAIERLQVVLCAVMLRRRKDSGQNDVLQLPGRRVHVVQCQFDEGEQQLYHTLEGRLRSKVEDWVKQGLVKTRFACVLEMLLCLCQACDHLALVGSSSIVNEDVSSLSSSDSLGGLSRYIEDLNAELDDLLARLYLEADDEL